MPDLRRMEYFVAVAEELSFTGAARRLHMSQPPLSMQIQQLEREIGVPLLDRSRRRVALTAAGEVFLEEARATLRQVARAAELARDAARGEAGRLDVGVVDAALYSLVPPIVRRFTELYPRVELSVSARRMDEQIELVSAGGLDVGFVHPPVAHAELAVEAAYTEPCVLVAPEDHPLAGSGPVPLAEIVAYPLIGPPRSVNPSAHDSVFAYCHERGLYPEIVREASPKQAIVALVAAGLGVSLLPAALMNHPHPGVVYRPVDDDGFGITTSLLWRRDDARPATLAFLEVARELRTSVADSAPS
ncbi:LysR family transcriptional regulator [Streptomyces sp. WAC 06738]|uniref:LysR family transcriptional regulator n=1 Tax=Streptomyces sp. WAC 06738 TaxID=2203210 RepID=UPI000F710719|nr:LysR substrate-binding domain-containing protein [Streptomyces sp. WAC 06738]AZM47716.1 LysR family transcriptional regulator [Streptomyces sp. WAC 06738]